MSKISPSRLSPRASRLVRAARVAHLATADARGQPLVIPICFVYDGKEFFSPIDEKPKHTIRLKRLRNLQENPKLSLVIDRYNEDWRRLAYVLITGEGKVLFRGNKHRRAVRLLRRKYSQYRDMVIQVRPLIVVIPRKVKIWGSVA